MAFGKQQQIDQLSDELTQCKGEKAELEGRLRFAQATGRVATTAEVELLRIQELGLIDEDAETAAVAAVVAEEKDRLTTELAEQLERSEYDRYVSQYRSQEGPAILEGLRTQFQADGTFAWIRDKARSDVTAELEATALEELRAEAREQASSPEEREAVRAKLREELKASPKLERDRAAIRAALEEQWRQEATVELRAEIREEEASKEEEFKAAYSEQYRTSDHMQRHRHRVRMELEDTWRQETAKEVAAAINDEELEELLGKRAAQEKAKLEKEVRSQQLLQEFEGRGIDISALPQDTRLEVFLGSVKTLKKEEEKTSVYGGSHKETIEIEGILCSRKLTLTSLGDRRFLVDGDSLLEDESPYARNDAIHRGTVITIGRKLIDRKQATLEPRLVADVPLYYDDDTEDPHFTDMLLPVADVKIDGLSARGLQHIEMVK